MEGCRAGRSRSSSRTSRARRRSSSSSATLRGRPGRAPAHRSRHVHARLNGVEIDTQGDAFFFAFARARDAVEAAVEAQRAHASAAGPKTRPCACAWGSTPASRRSAARATSASTSCAPRGSARRPRAATSSSRRRRGRSSARRCPRASRSLRSAQRHLKDLDQPEQVYELAIEGVESDGGSRGARARLRSRMPSSVTAEGVDQRTRDRELRAAFGSVEADGASRRRERRRARRAHGRSRRADRGSRRSALESGV